MSRDEYFWKAYKEVLSVQCADIFYNFLFLNWWKNQKNFVLLLWNCLLILKILPVTCFKYPEAAILTFTESLCDSVKSYRKLPVTFLHIFPAANKRSAQENIDQSQKKEFWGGFQEAFSKLVSNFKEANKKLIIV